MTCLREVYLQPVSRKSKVSSNTKRTMEACPELPDLQWATHGNAGEPHGATFCAMPCAGEKRDDRGVEQGAHRRNAGTDELFNITSTSKFVDAVDRAASSNVHDMFACPGQGGTLR